MTPKELGELADEYWLVREARLQADKVAADLKTTESSLFAKLIAEMQSESISTIGGQHVSLKLNVNDEPVVTDWELLYGAVIESGDFSLLQRRLSAAAVKERWLAGEQVPGVGTFPVYRLSKSKL